MMEIWKDIKGYKGLYQVSNIGRVRGLDRFVNAKSEGVRIHKGVILKNIISKQGYYVVGLYNSGKRKLCKIHRLVAGAFIGEIPKGMTTNHKDGDKLNNHVNNLEICTQLENNKHARETGLNNILGENHGNSKYTESQVIEIRESFADWIGTKKDFRNKMYPGVSYSAIKHIINRTRWSHI